MITTRQKLLAICAHIGYFLGIGFILIPLAIMLFCKDDEFVEYHAKQALCMQVVFAIVSAGVTILCSVLIGVVFLPFLGILGLLWFVCSLLGAWHALNGELYAYPLTGSLVSKLENK